MKNLKLGSVIALVACFLFWAGAAGADLYNNLASPVSGSDSISIFGPLYDSFSTGAGGFSLADVKVLISANPSTGSISVGLYSDSSTSPGGLLTTIGTRTDNTLPSSLSVVDFPLGSPYSLGASERYWLGIASTDGSTAVWAWALDQTALGVAGEYFAAGKSVYPNNFTGPYQMALSSTAVPLPGALLLLGPALAGLAAIRRRFKK
jgi:hypothetical protein